MTMMNFNDAEPQQEFGLIPENTIAKARLAIKLGNDFSDPFLTRSKNGDSSYLDCEFVIMEGQYVRRKVFEKIGISGSEMWEKIGKSRIRALLESAKNINPKDSSDAAKAARKINSYDELDGLEAVIKIGIERDRSGVHPDKNRIMSFITPDKPAYNKYMNEVHDDIPW
jgi:hypothetical protein